VQRYEKDLVNPNLFRNFAEKFKFLRNEYHSNQGQKLQNLHSGGRNQKSREGSRTADQQGYGG
jgi:hypothetical protein